MQSLRFNSDGFAQMSGQYSIPLAVSALRKFCNGKLNAMSGYELSVQLSTALCGVELSGKAIRRALEKVIELQNAETQELREVLWFVLPMFKSGRIRTSGKKNVKYYWEDEI